MRERACEAEHHVQGCPCVDCKRDYCGKCKATNIDYFTAKCVGKALGMRPKEINREENLQHLSRVCHIEKDRSTPARARLAFHQRRGADVDLEQYRRFRNDNDLIFKDG